MPPEAARSSPSDFRSRGTWMISTPLVDRAWEATPFSHRLSGRRRHSTTPELALRRAVYSAGGRYRLQTRLTGGLSADLAFPGSRVVVMVDGCFWHGCPTHGRTEWRGPNAE